MSFEKFQDGRHLGHGNGTILVILDLCVTVMPPIKFQPNQTYGLGGDVVWKISRWPPWWPSCKSDRNNFSNSESLCHCDASHQVLAQSDLRFGRRCHLRISRWLPWRPSWILEGNEFSNFESLCHCYASSIGLTVWEEMSFEEFQDGHRGSHLGYQNGTILAILKIYNTPMPPIKFWLNWTYCLGGDVIWRMAAILDIGTEWF